MKEVEVGKMWIPDSVLREIENHRHHMIDDNFDNPDVVRLVEQASFSTIFSDYLWKYGCKLLND